MPFRSVTTEFALRILTAAAEEMGMSPTDLDHAVWQWQRGGGSCEHGCGLLRRSAGRTPTADG
ncbi:hypothetical protein A5700_00920 [Mycobacterium sp. E1214]|nr:hypothetical protein A5700_00920 [Mycobacterium sp. E1214]OBH30530.1 hypothetical protein A5693_17745 [Mycobacterium sp. E1319]